MEIKSDDQAEVCDKSSEENIQKDPKPFVRTPSICKRCSVRVNFNQSLSIQTRDGFEEQYKLLDESPDSFNLIRDDLLSTLTSELRSRPENTCFLCAGLLQNNTVQTLMNTCKELLSEYQCVGSVGVTCSNVDLLNVRSYLCGVGKINLQIKTVFKWLMADELTRFLGVPQVLQNASKADDQDLMVSKIIISY